jgi:serine/threonine-protein kinase
MTQPLAPETSSHTIHGAARVGRYELLMELASGGMATVFIGRQRGAGGFERIVAIKRMHPHIGAIPELAASFMDEARIASLIHHPNVVSVHDVHESDGERLLVMDYIDGTSLAALIKGARRSNTLLPIHVSIYIISQALRGLHAAHEQKSLTGAPLNIVHRDATPQNILLGVDGSVRLTDFGIAKAAERSAHTTTGNVKGKFRYMAPEQAMGKNLDRRVDIFALGVVLWEMLSGQRFLKGESDAEIIHNLAMAQFEDLHQVEPSIPPELSLIVMTAVAANPDRRWATAEQFADALDYWARSTGYLASATDVAAQIQTFCQGPINTRHHNLAEILAGRRPPVSIGIPSSVSPAELATGSNASIAALSNVGSTILPTTETPLPRPFWRHPAVLVSASLVGLFGGAISLRAATATAPAPAVPASTPAPAPSAPPVEKIERVTISLSSERVITEIKAPDADDIQFRDDGASFSLPRGAAPVTVVLRFSDQTSLEETFTPSGNISRRLVATTAKKTDDKSAKNATPPRGGDRPATRPADKPTDKPADKKPTLKTNPYD